MREFDYPLQERIRRSEQKKARYLNDPRHRLEAINRARRNLGMTLLDSLEASANLRLPLRGKQHD